MVGYQSVTLTTAILSAGTHKLAIGIYNNKKTYNNEATTFVVNRVQVTMTCPDLPDPTSAPVPDPTNAPVPDPTNAPDDDPVPTASQTTPTDPQSPDFNCMEDNWFKAKGKNGGGLVCAAKEVTLVDIQTERSVCREGEMFPIDFNATVKFNTARYDAGWYVALDGGDAMTGTCKMKYLKDNGEDPKVIFDAPDSDIAVGQIRWDNDFKGKNDVCGDVFMNSGGGGVLQHMNIAKEVRMMCTDKNDNGNMDFGICFSWRQPGRDDTCDPEMLYPGSPSKCFCTRYEIPQITVEKLNDPVLECL
jgi:hypothetical protein